MVTKMLLPLRIGVFETGYMITRGYRVLGAVSGVKGFASQWLFSSMRDIYPRFNISYVWTENRWELAGHLVNGSYTGLMGLLERNKSDMSFVPLPSLAEASPVVEFGPIFDSFPTGFVTTLQVGSYEENVLAQLFRFSIWTVVLTILAIISFGLTLSACEKMRKSHHNSFSHGAWKMLEMLLNQAQAEPRSQAGKLLATFTVAAVFFWLQLWQSQMTTELCGYDTSNVAQTFEDVIRLNKTPLLLSQEPSTILFEQEARMKPDSIIGQIFKRSEVADMMKMGNKGLSSEMRSDLVRKFLDSKKLQTMAPIASLLLVKVVKGVACGWSEFDYLLGKDQVLDAPQSYWFSKFLNPEIQKILFHKQVLMRESGNSLKLYKEVFEMVPQLMKDNFENRQECVYDSLEQYLTKLQEETPISIYLRLWQIKSVFMLVFWLFVLSIVILLIEFTNPSQVSSLKYLMPGKLFDGFRTVMLLHKWKTKPNEKKKLKRQQENN